MADVLCPHCGMPNPPEQALCTFCQKPVHKDGDSQSIRPGEAPTKKTTAELESILPDWLRNLRQGGQAAAEEKTADLSLPTSAPPPAPEPARPVTDFLAGLQMAAQDDGDDEIPEWMRGAAPTPAPAAPEKTGTPSAHRQELHWDDDQQGMGGMATTPIPAPPESGEAMLPWMQTGASLGQDDASSWFSEPPKEPAQPVSPFANDAFKPPETGELTDWLARAAAEAESAPASPSPANETSDDWLSSLPREILPDASDSETVESFGNDIDLPAWMQDSAPAAAPAPAADATPPAIEPPDWLASLKEEPAASASQKADDFDLPAWMQDSAPAAAPAPAADATPPAIETPDWLASLKEEPAVSAPQKADDFDLPAWMQDSAPAAAPAPAADVTPPAIETPDWLASLKEETAASAPQKTVKLPDAEKPSSAFEMPAADASQPKGAAEEIPDWLASLEGQAGAGEVALPFAEAGLEVPRAPAFVGMGDPAPGIPTDELFSIEMPDWLSSIAPTDAKPSAPETPETTSPSDALAPAELPSWVQAMRPVETILPEAAEAAPPAAEGPLEERGPLAGLRGVLPLEDSLLKPGKPRAQGIRLQVSEAQESEVALLEQMLAAETQPKPLRGGMSLVSQRVLRWALSLLMILLVSSLLLTRTQLTPLPGALSQESASLLPVMDGLPEGAPVLLIVDYEPALAGEMEAAAAPFLTRGLALHSPRVFTLSTSPTGPALTGQLFRTRLSSWNDWAGQNYVPLGYLPGGTMGIAAFAGNPRASLPVAAWNQPAAQGVTRFSDFAVVILLTDRAETARAWVEQTMDYREGRPLLVISSAQAAPMIQPYLISRQVNGLVNGLHDGAAFESAVSESLARRYWDAYNFATLFAALLMIFGGVWNFVVGVRARRQNLDEV